MLKCFIKSISDGNSIITKLFLHDTISITTPLMYFRLNYITVFAFNSCTIIVTINGIDLFPFPLTDIPVTVIDNGKHTAVSFSNPVCFRMYGGNFRSMDLSDRSNKIASRYESE